MPRHVEPSIRSKGFSCPRYGAHSDQDWFNTYAEPVVRNGTPWLPPPDALIKLDQHLALSKGSEERASFEAQRLEIQRRLTGDVHLERLRQRYCAFYELENLFVSVCYSCRQPTIWLFDKIIYPDVRTEVAPNDDLDRDIQQDFLEAASIVDKSPRGAAALLRLCIQRLCKQAGGKGQDINTDIQNFVQKGLDSRIQQALDVVRVTGNQSVHPGEMDLRDDRATAIQLFLLVNTVADALISQPKRIQALFDNLPEGAKKAIEKRDMKGRES